jgi:hypothetical protein
MQHAPIANWIPYRLLYSIKNGWTAKWLDLGKERMTHPFFDETIQVCRCRQRERSALESLSSAGFLSVASESVHALAPSSFIFHVSRCGSTLLSQAFSDPEENIVIAEAPLLDEILRAAEKDAQISAVTRESWFRSAIKLMGQKRNFRESSYIIKLDSWHVHFYETLREWFPQTPFFFLYRRPDEVIASHEKKRGIHTVPGMVNSTLLRTGEPACYQGDFNRYTARVLQEFYIKMQHIHRLNHRYNYFFDYADGVNMMVDAFSRFANIPMKNSEQVHSRLQYHSKSPKEVFQPAVEQGNEKYFYEDCYAAYEQLKILTL